jgi:hypothetical protein
MVYGKISLNEIKYFNNKRLDKVGGEIDESKTSCILAKDGA